MGESYGVEQRRVGLSLRTAGVLHYKSPSREETSGAILEENEVLTYNIH